MTDHRISGQLADDLAALLKKIRKNSNSNVTTLKSAKTRLATDVRLADEALEMIDLALQLPPEPPDEPPPPPPPPPPQTGKLQIGLVPGGDETRGIQAAERLGMTVMRSHDKSPGQSAADMAGTIRYAAGLGIETIILMGDTSPSSPGKVGEWALAFGPGDSRNALAPPVRFIEWGNEDCFSYKVGAGGGRAYGNSARAAYQAIQAANPRVGLLLQAGDGNAGNTEGWLDNLFAAWPEAKTLAAGWTVHPYGPPGKGLLQRCVASLKARGVPSPVIFCTEDGMSTDNGRMLSDNYGWPKNQTYAQAAAALQEKVDAVEGTPEVAVYLIYQGYDQKPSGTSSDREHFFGAYQNSGADKGPYTAAVKALAEIHGGS